MLTAALATYLDSLGLVVFGRAGADCGIEAFPPKPADAISIGLKPGDPDDLSGDVVRGIAIMVRQASADAQGRVARPGWARATAIRAALHGLRHTTLAAGTDDEQRIHWCVSDDVEPTSLGTDQTGARLWGLRFRVQTAAPDTAWSTV